MNSQELRSFIVFSDLDGCLLNADYSHREAAPALARLRTLGIPLVLASSKTEAEMVPLADELETAAPLICENGGVIAWRGNCNRFDRTTLGTSRETILQNLESLNDKFQFRSFANLGESGIAVATGLPPQKARLANQRMTVEPLIWDESDDRIPEFRDQLESRGLTLTRGGRFWHVSGPVNKGMGLEMVLETMSKIAESQFRSVAIGDSPIDTSMLERADVAIVIPGFDGQLRLQVQHAALRIASHPGASGWNEAMHDWLDSFSNSDHD